jgi:hypothetical protein
MVANINNLMKREVEFISQQTARNEPNQLWIFLSIFKNSKNIQKNITFHTIEFL